MPKRLPVSTDDLVQAYQDGASLRELAERSGMSHEGIRQRLERAHCPLRPIGNVKQIRRKYPLAIAPHHAELIRHDYAVKKQSIAKLAASYGYARDTIRAHVADLVQVQKRPDISTAEIVALYEREGWSMPRIARHLETHYNTIRQRLISAGAHIRHSGWGRDGRMKKEM